jgi:hypothetical protein
MLTVVQFSFGNLHKSGDRATQVEQRVHFDSGLVRAEPRPGENRQTEVDGGGVQGVDGVVEIESERLVPIHRARHVDEHLREIGEDAPVVRFVGIGQGGARDSAAKTHVIELALHRAQTGFDVTEALPKGQLGKGETKKLIEAGKSSEFVVAAVALNALVELVRRDVIDELGEDHASGMHGSLSIQAARSVPWGSNQPRKLKSKKVQIPPMPMTERDLLRHSKAIAGQ